MTQDENGAATGSGAGSGPSPAEPLPARNVEVETYPLPEHDVVSGHPSAGSRTVRSFGEVEIGIWEMTAGSARDVEADEVFVVLSGAASVRFDDGREISLRSGDMMSLSKGERTVWTMTETLRKVYVLHSNDAAQE